VNVVFLLLATLIFALYSIFMKYVPKGNLRFNIFVTVIYAGIVTLMYLVMFIFDDHKISSATLLWAVLKGVIGIAVQTSYFAAMQSGPLSYTTFIFSSSMIIPALASPVLWNEQITLPQWIAIALFLVAFYLICVPGADKTKKLSKAWLPFCLSAFLLNGFGSVILKIQQTELKGGEGNAMMFLSYGTTCIAAFLVFVIWALVKKEKIFPEDMKIKLKTATGSIIGVALANGIANGFVTYLASRMSGAWLFPCVLGGSMITVTLFSVIALKEKINKFGKIGLVTGLVAMFVMNVI